MKTEQTLFERYSEKFKKIAPLIARGDKLDAALKLKLTSTTVGRYIKGEVRSFLTAEKLLNHFTEVIARRENQVGG